MEKKVGFIGLGSMGGAFAERLIKQGYDTVVYDVAPAAVEYQVGLGATAAESPKAVAEQCDVVMSSLPNPPIVNDVYLGADGIIGGVREGMLLIDLSTIDPGTTRKNQKIFKEKGVDLVDSPVSGGHFNILEGTLPTILVGGEKEAVDRAKEYLSNFGSNIYECGGPGCGNVLKLINNMMSLTNNAICAEALVLGTKLGVDPDLLYDILVHGACRSFHLVNFYPSLLRREFFENGGFKIDLGKKDVGLALDMAKQINQPVPIGATIYQLYTECSADGWGNDDCLCIAKMYERWAGVEVKGKGEDPEPGLI